MAITTFLECEMNPLMHNTVPVTMEDGIRILFSPVNVTPGNLKQTLSLYRALEKLPYDTFVIVETYNEILPKKIPMPSAHVFKTPYGEVPANDSLRNDFADEEDDFYIDDSAFNPKMSLFQQLMLLQTTRKDFSVVSLQLSDQRPAIVKELAWVISEVMSTRNAGIIFCCELASDKHDQFQKLNSFIVEDDMSGLMNYINREGCEIQGIGAFLAGILVARTWEMDVRFKSGSTKEYGLNLLAGYAGYTR